MKIDPRVPLPGSTQTDNVKNSQRPGGQSQGASGPSATNAAAGEDTVNISRTPPNAQSRPGQCPGGARRPGKRIAAAGKQWTVRAKQRKNCGRYYYRTGQPCC
jgi:hypothetical protein